MGRAIAMWREASNQLEEDIPDLRKKLTERIVQAGCPWSIGTLLEIAYGDVWKPCIVKGFHSDGAYVVQLEEGAPWGDTIRRVLQERLRPRAAAENVWLYICAVVADIA